MANGFLDELGDIFTGGIQTALEIEAEKRRREIEFPRPPRGDIDRGIRTDDGRIVRAGSPSGLSQQLASVPLALWVAAGVGLVVVLVLLRR